MPLFEFELLPRAETIWSLFAQPRDLGSVVARIFETPPRARNVVESRHSPVLTHEFLAEAFGSLYLVVAVVIERPAGNDELWQVHAVYPVLTETEL